eukprot:TCONS_00022582-protein
MRFSQSVYCWNDVISIVLCVQGGRSVKYLENSCVQMYRRTIWMTLKATERFNEISFVTSGGNVALDMGLEHLIKVVKMLKKRLGPHQKDEKILDKYLKALPYNKALLENFDKQSGIYKRSGEHKKASNLKDKLKIVDELLRQEALKKKKERKYSNFRKCQDSLLKNFDISDYYKWISDHKNQIATQKTVR